MNQINNSIYTILFENMLNAFAHCQAVYNDAGDMIDWIYLSANPAFEKHVNLKNVEGRKASELMPTLLETNPEVFERFGRVSKGGEPESFEQYVEALDQSWFSVTVYSVEWGTFTEIFNNITESKKRILEIEKSHRDLLMSYDETLMCLVRALQFRDRDTEDHSARVMRMTVDFARYVGIEEKYISDIRRGAMLHDIGKIFIPDVILQKPGRLTYDEMAVMQTHPQLAYDLLAPISYLKGCVLDIPFSHHERWDGSGYPRSLRGTQIPLCARLFAIVDVFDAMTSQRIYREERTLSKNFTTIYLSVQAGILFDPELTKKFLKFIEEYL